MAVNLKSTERRTMNIEDFARTVGISRPLAYDLARRDQLPVPTIKVGKRMVISTAAVEELLSQRKDTTDDGSRAA